MGYPQEWRMKVLRASITGYMRVLQKESAEGKPRNRKGVETLKSKRFQKLVGQQEWFRTERETPDAWEVQAPNRYLKGECSQKKKFHKKDTRYIESVMFLPFTPESTLRNRVTKLEEKLGNKTRFRISDVPAIYSGEHTQK